MGCYDDVLVFILILVTLYHRLLAISICEVNLIQAQEGEVTSPNFPYNYPSNTNCTLVIDVGPNNRIDIEFKDFRVEENDDMPGSCLSAEYLEISEGSKNKIYCGYKLPTRYQSTASNVTIRFITDKHINYMGFRLLFSTSRKVLADSICPTRYIKKDMSGSFSSPNYPNLYTNNEQCRLTVSVPDNYMMNVWFTAFHLQRSLVCSNDYLLIKDENGGWKMCGGGENKIPKRMKFVGNTVRMEFKSDSSVGQRGFLLHYNMTRLREGQCVCTQGLEYISINNFKSKIRRNNNVIKFLFKTSRPNGLIMFSKGRLRDYIYIGISNGRLFYQADLGTGSGRVISPGRSLNDNKWHKVQITRQDKIITIAVDDRFKGYASTRGPFNRLDIPDSIGFFLGAPSSIKGLVGNFVGCIRDLQVDELESITNAFAGKPFHHTFGRERFRKC
ncbi:dorsal-ventral patterning tolloid-like protein 1 [Actinia tenebrosa]|uniref:Dorsal-ventral patterning tolloid-like protein 1 n=1 Tax=Actinia tenebrosa TaxID=6105 RepID=A0A6P8HU22_ACTTE|nr:dorsal-ventral patterning tolloid-like protein 1 [Actinia tenebrosa]